MVWNGAFGHYSEYLVDMIKKTDYFDPEHVAQRVGRTMEHWFEESDNIDLLDEAKELGTGYYIFILGYNAVRAPKLYMLESINENRFEPKGFDLQPGWIEFQAFDRSTADTAFPQLFNYNYKVYQDLEHANRQAFREVIGDLKDEGLPVGGEIFTETLRPS
jgi:hypothetical protein